MARSTDGTELLKCFFCEKNQEQIHKPADDSGIYICDECIELCNETIGEELGERFTETSSAPLPASREAKEFLDSWVTDQGRAKRALSVVVHNHYKRVRSREANNEENMLDTKSNILLSGPTGTGKIHPARGLARLLHVPFVIVDTITLIGAGCVGEDAKSTLLRLIQEADGSIRKAECDIICIDEIGEIGRKGKNASIARDISGEGIQQVLLKITEGTVASVPPQGGRKHPYQQFLEIGISGIPSIVAGVFAGIEDIVGARIGQRSIGFGSDLKSKAEVGDLYEAITLEDLHRFDVVPGFIGRLPVLTFTEGLAEEGLVRVLIESRNSLFCQY